MVALLGLISDIHGFLDFSVDTIDVRNDSQQGTRHQAILQFFSCDFELSFSFFFEKASSVS